MFGKNRATRIVKQAMPAVVTIVVAEKLEDFEKGLAPEVMAGMPKQADGKTLMVPDSLIDAHGLIQVAGGTGFIVDADGIVVTNKHVVGESNATYTVLLNDGRKFTAEILTRDPLNDVAILKINARRLPFLPLGDATKLDLGEDVIAIGNALGLYKNTVSRGIVSGLSRSVTAQSDPGAPMAEMRGLIQTDAALNPGNSGGPLISLDKGRVVGINSATTAGAHSIGFAIPINTVARDLHDLRKYGRIRRPLLGLRYVVIDERLKEKTNLPSDYGALVMGESPRDKGVVIGSPAYEAGVAEHDIVLSIDEEKITREKTIQDILENRNVGDTIELQILRNGKPLTLSVLLAERK